MAGRFIRATSESGSRPERRAVLVQLDPFAVLNGYKIILFFLQICFASFAFNPSRSSFFLIKSQPHTQRRPFIQRWHDHC
jgi:hypothetical protein